MDSSSGESLFTGESFARVINDTFNKLLYTISYLLTILWQIFILFLTVKIFYLV